MNGSNYTMIRQEGYNALWNAEINGCPYEDETQRYAWFQGYYQAQDDIATGNY